MADEKTFTKEDVDAAITAAVAKVQESVSNLEAKRDELIAENRKLKRGAEIKPEDLQAAEDRADKLDAALKEAQKAAKDATSAKEKAEKALQEETSFTQKLVGEGQLRDLLHKGGVTDPDYLDMMVRAEMPNIKVVREGDQRKALGGDEPLADYVGKILASERGKKVVSAPANSGGGASGGDRGKSATVKTMTRSAYDALDQNAKSELMPQLAKRELTIVDDAA